MKLNPESNQMKPLPELTDYQGNNLFLLFSTVYQLYDIPFSTKFITQIKSSSGSGFICVCRLATEGTV